MHWHALWYGVLREASQRGFMSEHSSTSAAHASILQISLRRRATDHLATFVAVLTVVLVLLPLVAIFTYLVYRGVGSINWAFLTQTPKPVGEPGGGMANAIGGGGCVSAFCPPLGSASGGGGAGCSFEDGP